MDNKPVENTNVIDLFTRKPLDENASSKIIRLAPETDGMEMLYSNDANPGKLFSMKILCWALRKDGSVDAMVPWLNRLVPARELNDPLNGHWEGYYDSFHETAYFEPPEYKVVELENAASFYNIDSEDPDIILQEINDNIGTHAILSEDSFKTVVLVHVTSWRLFNDGRILAMVANEEEVDTTPILAGDDCLYAAQEHENFRYFFHHVIANKIKKGDPDAISAFTQLVDE
ncbi:hypothetical protein [Endozoicomonas euniceicola]|uniref:Uncharacterized protein n=1 Tax=Endozoicomonas euniceicola TaxID=1234143 RepID=A0ABY6GYQ5_9GAMM|nr:hypothetical protein [Endozoicomonas euniceicola]UYM17044.1 hypothetical protein NX720_03705 [Endozoicomonas euniceicola]